MTALLVLDFDGTVTDAEVEGAPFRDGYLGDVAVLCGRELDEVMRLAEAFEAEVASDPDAYGWIYDGQIVAPATVDPYLRIMPVARKIFDAFQSFQDEGDRTRLLDGVLYKYNYTKTTTAFRPGAREVLEAVQGDTTYVVTNSHTLPVQGKIRSLGAQEDGSNSLASLLERVRGRAKKYVLDRSFDALPEAMTLPGLSRPVLLRRRHYFEVLDGLRNQAGADWSDVLVVGDIFELDLALPLQLGARIGLVVNDFTPAYEKAFVSGHARGELVHRLDQIPGLVGLS